MRDEGQIMTDVPFKPGSFHDVGITNNQTNIPKNMTGREALETAKERNFEAELKKMEEELDGPSC